MNIAFNLPQNFTELASSLPTYLKDRCAIIVNFLSGMKP